MRLLIMGPPGAGKGTQAAVIAGLLGVPHISTGDLFRAHLSQGTPLGEEAKKYIQAGEYVPDAVTNGMVRDRLKEPDARPGFLLDGYPRTVQQVAELDGILGAGALDAVIELVADADEVVQRLLGRGAVEGRVDDNEEIIRHRLDLYNEQTAPLTQLYRERGILHTVDGIGEVTEVTQRILSAIRD